GQGDGNELVGEDARLERRLGATLALDGEAVLLGARDLVALRDYLGRLTQRNRPFLLEPGIREPPSHRRVRGLRGPAAPRLARLEGHVGRARHVLDAARDEYVALTGLDRLAALAAAWRPEPHNRFTVWPGTSTGRPARSSAMRA